MEGLEYELWSAVIGEPCSYGLSEDERLGLAALSEALGGWLMNDPSYPPRVVDIVEWKRRYEDWRDRGGTNRNIVD